MLVEKSIGGLPLRWREFVFRIWIPNFKTIVYAVQPVDRPGGGDCFFNTDNLEIVVMRRRYCQERARREGAYDLLEIEGHLRRIVSIGRRDLRHVARSSPL